MRRLLGLVALVGVSACASGDVVGAAPDTDPQLGEDGSGSTDAPVTTGASQPADDTAGDASAGEATSSGADETTSSSTGDGGGETETGSTTGEVCVDEVCDGVDNDCDREIDENGCACLPGDTQDCYEGPEGTEGIGLCTGGTQSCADDGQSWEACADQVTPIDEICNGEDDDCDTLVDDDLGSETCGQGICQVTVDQVCVDGVEVACEPLPAQPAEICINSLDDDCNGLVDDGCACESGQVYPCYTGPAGTAGVGVCQEGTQQCTDGTLEACVGAITPVNEACNGLDDDCDGSSDEGNPGGGQGCDTGSPGPCGPGVTVCSGGSTDCSALVSPSAEQCNAVDDDCDGTVDDGNPGGGQGCATGLPGVCSAGTTACMFGGIVCNQNVGQSGEVCDGLDNDCDGSSDELNPGGGQACSTGLPGVCSAGTTTCSGGSLQCNQNTGASNEVCDGLDNDCDGSVDQGNPGGGGACNTGLSGQCAAGTFTCSGGVVQCIQNQGPTGEICDNVDNNCNGSVDENNPGGGLVCSTGLPGVCSAGTTACSSGSVICNQNQGASGEVCDGLDNNCDGTVDEGVCGCAHDVCTTGVALVNGCSSCVSQICGVDAFCCSTSWDGVCVNEVASVCGQLICPAHWAGCAHSPCVSGVILASGCDTAGCVAQICAVDAFCCSTSWDGVCVGEVSSVCGLSCT